MSTRNPVETKVIAGAGGAAGGAATSTFLVWLLGVTVWGAPNDADHATDAVLAVPAPVSVLLGLAVTALFAYAAGYLAKHTARDTGALNGSLAVTLAAVLVAIAALIYILGHVDLHG